MRNAILVLLAAATLMLAACGGGDDEGTTTVTVLDTETTIAGTTESETTAAEPDESPAEFLRRRADYELRGQFGRSWDELHPAHQAVVTRDRYDDCRPQSIGALQGAEIESFDVLETYDDPINIAGVPEKTSKAVTVKLVLSKVGETATTTDTWHAVQVGDHWVWLLEPGDVRDYKAGTCPT